MFYNEVNYHGLTIGFEPPLETAQELRKPTGLAALVASHLSHTLGVPDKIYSLEAGFSNRLVTVGSLSEVSEVENSIKVRWLQGALEDWLPGVNVTIGK